jgi:hypothetical protein
MCPLGNNGECSDRKRVPRAQAAILLKFAKTTKDPDVSAALIGKAADLKVRVDENCEQDLTPLAPDVERPDRNAG